MFGLFSKQEKKFKKYLTSITGDSTWSLAVASVTIRNAKKWGIAPDVLMHESQKAIEENQELGYIKLEDIAHSKDMLDGYFKGTYLKALDNILGTKEMMKQFPNGLY